MPRYATLRDRINANSVERDMGYMTPCRLWTGPLNSAGYAQMCVRMKRGPRKGKPVQVLVHRVVLSVFKERVLSGRKKSCHMCNVKHCVNEEHLYGGTARQNMQQCVREGRHWSGFKGKKVTA